MQNRILILIAGAMAMIGCTRTSPSQMIVGEAQVTSDGLALTSGNVILTEGRPGIAFALATKPGQSKEFTYFVVCNHDFPKGGVNTECACDGPTGHTSHTITAFGNNCKIEYRIGLSADKKSVEMETTLIADTPYDPSKGNLFLIDMKAAPAIVTQLDLELPSETPDLNESSAIEKFGQDTLNRLRKLDKTCDEFCRRIEIESY